MQIKRERTLACPAPFFLLTSSATKDGSSTTMIRLFTALCNAILQEFIDEQLFLKATHTFNHSKARCPRCGAPGKLSPHGDYSRFLISFEGGLVVVREIHPLRFECASCLSTHALLPDIIVPYSPYSLTFKLAVLLAYFERKTTVESICERFGIAISTLYKWKKNFLSHKKLLIGVLASQKTPALQFIHKLLTDTSAILQLFFRKHAFSFLQGLPSTTTRSIPP